MTKPNDPNPTDAQIKTTDAGKGHDETSPRPGMVRNYVAERKLMQIIRYLESESERLKRNGSNHAQTVESNLRAVEKIIIASPSLESFVNVDAASGRSVHAWPWGTHETKLLRQLADAADHFWKLYEPKEPSTAPENGQVVEWLHEHGVSERTAQIMATILRADGLASGPRKR